jgi:Glycosyltransferase like family 2
MMTKDRAAKSASEATGEGERRPPVSVVVPFLGDRAEAGAMLEAYSRLELGDRDEIVIVDNGASGVLAAALRERTAGTDGDGSIAGGRLLALEAGEEHSPYYARNVGAERASGEWLLFSDADCRPSPTLLDDFFARPIAPEVGALAGGIRPAPDQTALVARWATSRRRMDPRLNLTRPRLPAAATANLLVRRRAWQELGGFLEAVREGADFELCWRLQDAGWRLELRPEAIVDHFHREGLWALLRQVSRDTAALAWLERRRPGSLAPARIGRGFATRAVALVVHALRRRREQAAMSAIDLAVLCAQAVGRLRGNAATREPLTGARGGAVAPIQGHSLVLAAELFPRPEEAGIAAELESLRAAGWTARVEALARPQRPRPGGVRGVAVSYLEDEGVLAPLAASVWLAARRPLRFASELGRGGGPDGARPPLRLVAPIARRLLAGGEQHLHVEAPGPAAAVGVRAARLADVSVSIGGDGTALAEVPSPAEPSATARG